jgi:hypothetical protein
MGGRHRRGCQFRPSVAAMGDSGHIRCFVHRRSPPDYSYKVDWRVGNPGPAQWTQVPRVALYLADVVTQGGCLN